MKMRVQLGFLLSVLMILVASGLYFERKDRELRKEIEELEIQVRVLRSRVEWAAQVLEPIVQALEGYQASLDTIERNLDSHTRVADRRFGAVERNANFKSDFINKDLILLKASLKQVSGVVLKIDKDVKGMKPVVNSMRGFTLQLNQIYGRGQ